MNLLSLLIKLATAMALLWLCVWPATAEHAVPPAGPGNGEVGTVRLLLGKAFRVSANGQRQALERGTGIAVRDRITTASNGHVHIHFIDDALVSVRPNSELEIVRYEFNQQRPELSAVKFNLEEGVTRAISGQAARSARGRFRLNTPIAAIGVRGTDFVVSADSDMTRARVYEGVIVMAPFSEACSISALGPCADNALELAAGTGQMGAMHGNGDISLPRLLPAQSIRNADMIGERVQQVIANMQQPGGSFLVPDAGYDEEADGFNAGVDKLQPGDVSGESIQAASNEVLLEGIANNTVAVDAEVAALAALEPKDFTASAAATLGAVPHRQLVWGRYAEPGLATAPLAVPFATASSGREVTVGNLRYGLFRAADSSRVMAENLGLVGFQLDSAQAVYNTATGVVAMAVNGGELAIDFQRNVFSTELQLNHPLTGQVGFSASGKVLNGGIFRALEETQRVAGAVSFDGGEAGYLFQRKLDDGDISGLTLWNATTN